MNTARVTGVGLAVAVLAIALLGSASALPPRAEGRIYANGELYATFVSTTVGDAPEQSFDALFTFPATGLISVAEAAPGEPHQPQPRRGVRRCLPGLWRRGLPRRRRSRVSLRQLGVSRAA